MRDSSPLIRFCFEAEVIYWRGPSPFFVVPTASDDAEEIRRVAKAVTYGWGMVPVEATIRDATFTTALFPKDETYLLPLKVAVRRKINITAGDLIRVEMTVNAVQR